MICPYCNQEALWCENEEVYGKNYGKSFMMYLCKPCDAYVGCHQNTKKPLGTLANKELREWRVKAHTAFDPYWRNTPKGKRGAKRQAMYDFLRRRLRSAKPVHIGESDVETCKKIIEIVNLKPWEKLNERV